MKKHTHSLLIQDIKLCKGVGLGYFESFHEVNGRRRKTASNNNPGVIYIDDPLSISVGDMFDGFQIVDIVEYPPQPTCRTLLMIKR